MPYIHPSSYDTAAEHPTKSGELNYAITLRLINFLMDLDYPPRRLHDAVFFLCKNYINYRGLSYTTVNEVIGVLECAKRELRRRTWPHPSVPLACHILERCQTKLYDTVLAPYEEQKITENGDVYPVDLLDRPVGHGS